MKFEARYNISAEIKPPSFAPDARLIARHRALGRIQAFETKSEPFDGGVCIVVAVPTMEIAMDLDIGWHAEGCFLPLAPNDRADS